MRLLTIRPVLILHIELAQPEIAQSNVACVIEQDILGFKVAVDDIESVQAFQGAEKFSSVKPCSVDIKALFFL